MVLWIPLPGRITEAVHPLLGATLLLVAARTPESGVETTLGQAIQQGTRLQGTAAVLRAHAPGAHAASNGVLVAVDDEFRADLARIRIPKLDHLRELVAGVHVQERKRNLAREKGFLGKPQHDTRIFADRIQHDRPGELGDSLAQDVDAFRLKGLKMVQPRSHVPWARELRRLGRCAGYGHVVLHRWLCVGALDRNARPCSQRLQSAASVYGSDVPGRPLVAASDLRNRSG